MASCSRNISLIASLVLMFLYISPSLAMLSVEVTGGDLNMICSHTPNPSFCVQALNSDPRTAKADFHGLAQISIDVAEKNAKQGLTILNSLIAGATSPTLKDRYTRCSVNYNSAIGFLDTATQKLNSGDLNGVANGGSSAQVEAQTCEKSFATPPPVPSSLQQNIHNLETLGKLVFDIAQYLSNPV